MSLLSNLVTNTREIARKSTVGFSTTEHPGDVYLRNGYYGIHRAAYGAGYGGINQDSAMSSAAVFGGIKIIAEDIGSLSLQTMSKTATGREPAYGHPLYNLLHDAPNPDQTAMEFRESLTAHALLCGSGYAGIERRSGRIQAFWPWMPYDTRRDRDSRGRPVYLHHESNQWKTYQPADVFILNGFGLTGRGGLAILEYARRTIGLVLSQEEYASRFFSQDQTPGLVLEHPGKTDVGLTKEAWKKARAGADAWHTPAVLQEGMKATLLERDNQKSQLMEARAFQLLEVCRLLRLSPHKLADMGRATWGNVEQLNINHYNETLRPWCERWEQSIKLRCLREENSVYVKHNIGGFLRGDFRTQTEGFSRMILTGVQSINEVRALMDLNPIEDGDTHYIPVNMAAVTEAANAITAMSANEPKSLAEIDAELTAQPDPMAALSGRNGIARH